jgi:hypothetical protein
VVVAVALLLSREAESSPRSEYAREIPSSSRQRSTEFLLPTNDWITGRHYRKAFNPRFFVSVPLPPATGAAAGRATVRLESFGGGAGTATTGCFREFDASLQYLAVVY